MYSPEPHSITFSTLISDIDKGIIKIPQFQRNFVWSLEESAKLIDSIIKGYPIGTFILMVYGTMIMMYFLSFGLRKLAESLKRVLFNNLLDYKNLKYYISKT
jgi:Protein of unknown function DUF262